MNRAFQILTQKGIINGEPTCQQQSVTAKK
jgi:hypothetical protein